MAADPGKRQLNHLGLYLVLASVTAVGPSSM
jgi:hypothetical protein